MVWSFVKDQICFDDDKKKMVYIYIYIYITEKSDLFFIFEKDISIMKRISFTK